MYEISNTYMHIITNVYKIFHQISIKYIIRDFANND